MTFRAKVAAAAAAAVLFILGIIGGNELARPHPPRPTPTISPSTAPAADPCHPAGVTYCALNPAVTQATIGKTICVVGWTSTVRPPASYTGPLKVQQLALLGAADQDPAHYEEDHRIPLELGGDPKAPANLAPELRTVAGGHAEDKDMAENTLKADVCAGRKTLAAAQLQMRQDWLGPGLHYTH